jgi:hypothetical protein
MLSIATIVGAFSLVVWLYLTLARFFWRIPRSNPTLPSDPISQLSVAAVIPARDHSWTQGRLSFLIRSLMSDWQVNHTAKPSLATVLD